MTHIRIGNGYDIHRMENGDGIIIGNVKIPFNKKFIAHSDGDVLIHAIIDAIFGALCDGDIGSHFPDTDPQYRNIDSAELLRQSVSIMHERGYSLGNLDANIICQQPRLRPHIDNIRNRLSELLKADISDISIKAKTKEHCDSVGSGEAVEVFVSVLLVRG